MQWLDYVFITNIVSAMRFCKQKHPTRRAPPSRLIQFHFNYQLRQAALHVSTDGGFTFLRDAMTQVSLSSSYLDALPMSNNENGVGCATLSPIWEALGIGPEYHCHLFDNLLPKIKEATAGRVGSNWTLLSVRVDLGREYADLLDGEEAALFLSGLGSVDNDGIGMVPTAREAVAALVKDVEAAAEGGGEEACAVCLEEVCYGGGSAAAAAEMPCGHRFHGSCIRKWLELSHYCPVCRFEMPTVGTEVAGVKFGGTNNASESVAEADS